MLGALALISLWNAMRIRIVPWALTIAMTGYASSAQAEAEGLLAAPVTSQPTAQVPYPTPGLQVVFQTNREEATLERRAGSVEWIEKDGAVSGTASLWTRVCTAPCRTVLQPGDELRIAGEGIAPSSSFRLQPGSREVRIDADAGSQKTLSLGKTFVSTGIGLLALGTVLLVVPAPGDDPSTANAFDTLRTIGYGSLGVGGALTLIGIPLWVSNGTSVTVSQSVPATASTPKALVVGARGTLQ